MGKQFRILCLDGGGIRGLITAIWLEALEQRLGGTLRHHFDLIAGTSTGAILACAVSAGMESKQIIDLYQRRGGEIFPGVGNRLWNRAKRTLGQGASAPKYDSRPLESNLRAVFGDLSFGDLHVVPTLVSAYNTLSREALVFKNSRTEFRSLPVWELCMASAAAPTYFPAHVMRVQNVKMPLIDGGVFANNPTACAIAEAVRVQASLPEGDRAGLDDFVVASFGTGSSTRPIGISDALEWGALEWAIPIIDVLFDGAADSVDYIASQLVAPDHYFRLQVPLHEAFDDMDDASTTNLNALANSAMGYLRTGGGDRQLDALAKLL